MISPRSNLNSQACMQHGPSGSTINFGSQLSSIPCVTSSPMTNFDLKKPDEGAQNFPYKVRHSYLLLVFDLPTILGSHGSRLENQRCIYRLWQFFRGIPGNISRWLWTAAPSKLLHLRLVSMNWWPSKVGIKVIRGITVTETNKRHLLKVTASRSCYYCALLKCAQRLDREARTWHALKHPNVLEFFGVVHNMGSFFALVSPYCRKGNIGSYLKCYPESNRLHLVSSTP